MDISMSLKNRYSMNLVSLTLIVKQCLEQELTIVNQFEGKHASIRFLVLVLRRCILSG
jgi:hypothetical protein